MKPEKRSDGSWRVRKMYKGQTFTLNFDHKPTQKEIIEGFSVAMSDSTTASGTLESFCKEYVRDRQHIASPSTIRKYNQHIKAMSDDFKKISMKSITQADIQRETNRYAKDHAPKTVFAFHGFIAGVIGVYRPQLTIRTTLPQKKIKENYLPTNDEVKAILAAAKGTEDSIGFQLGILSLRRAEICALTMDDLKGNELHVHANKVYDENNRWVIKETPKTDMGNRTVYLPDNLVEEIEEKGYFFKYSPQKLNQHLQEYQRALGIQSFRFHDLRHYFASYAHAMGIPDADIMVMGGWKSDYVFKQIYRESMKEKRKESAKKFNAALFD